MKKYLKITLLVVIAIILVGTFVFLYQKSKPKVITYEIVKPEVTDLQKTTVATGKVEPRDEILIESTSSYCYVNGMEELHKVDGEEYRTCFNIDGGTGNYYLTFTFSNSIVEWDEYSGEAWYEHPKWKKK